MVSNGPQLSSIGFKRGQKIRGKFATRGEEEEFVVRPRHVITRCTYGYGGKVKSKAPTG